MMKTVNGKIFGLENSLTRKTINYSQKNIFQGKYSEGMGESKSLR